jgi:VIT1/CCC1 family predicted Fe2+/Mn2+ transporter
VKIRQPTTRRQSSQFRALLTSEQNSAALYRGLAEKTTGDRRMIFLELAAVEDRHARHWATKLGDLGQSVPDQSRIGLRSRALTWLAGRSSIDTVLPYIERAEKADAGLYDGHPYATRSMAVDERAHARVITRLRNSPEYRDTSDDTDRLPVLSAARADEEPPPDPDIAGQETWHRSDRSGALRAAVFGVNDGLVSNSSLVMGFAGSGAASSTILFAGLAGLLAGAFSMAAGEYISMRSQRDAFEREIELEAAELDDDPDAEAEELALIYRAKGVATAEATRLAATIMSDRQVALDTMTREELGLDPDELGSPWSAALSSLVAFAAGAAVVVLPFLFGSGPVALVLAIVLAALALFVVGAALGVLNGRAAMRSGFRQLTAGAIAGIIVFAIGHLIGAAVT